MNKNECASRKKDNGCSKLTVKRCSGADCPFAQTKAQARASLKKANKRLASVGKEEQKHISDMYYFGKMPWLKGGVSNDN